MVIGEAQPTGIRIAERERIRGCSGVATYQMSKVELEFLAAGRTDLIPTAADRGIKYPERADRPVVWPNRTPRRNIPGRGFK